MFVSTPDSSVVVSDVENTLANLLKFGSTTLSTKIWFKPERFIEIEIPINQPFGPICMEFSVWSKND